MAATLFVFFVSGASSMLMGNLMPFLRETYDISYTQAGFLLSLPSWGNLASIFITGYLPTYIGRRKTVLLTSVWMAVAFVLVSLGLGGAALLADGILTPAVTVTTAVEGLRSIPVMDELLGSGEWTVVFITLAIISLLFSIQHAGTSRIGKGSSPRRA